MTEHVDVVIVGGGIVGVATAHRLVLDHPGLRVVVCEKERGVGQHQTGHNSGVLHAGLYYEPGSLKARLCRDGKAELEAFCRTHDLPLEVHGKVVVALDASEVPALDNLEQRARANGVPGLRRLTGDELREVEPHAAGIAGLHSPTTAVTDFALITRALERELLAHGGEVRTSSEVIGINPHGDRVHVSTLAGSYEARAVITCAGLQSDRVAGLTSGRDDVRVVPFRGAYRKLRPEAARLVRGSIYPVPDPRYPFLGVHLTRRVSGEVWVGPNAMLALAREDYRREAVSGRDVVSAFRYAGFWKLARRTIGTGAREAWHELVGPAYIRQVQRYVPELTSADLLPGPNGIRAQAVGADGSLIDDFLIEGDDRVLHVRNAPSPAATASFAIARHLAERIAPRLP